MRQLAADDLRRVLFGATGAAGGFDQLSVFFRAGEQCEVSFDCNFARIDGQLCMLLTVADCLRSRL